MLIGVDLDHTIIDYRNLFYLEALQRNWILEKHLQDKESIKNTLKKQNMESSWQSLQSIVYGKKIKQAIPFKGASSFFCRAENAVIISHKTKVCHRGSYLLQSEALKWINKDPFLSKIPVFFASSLEEKCKIIDKNGCVYFIDDLPLVLENISSSIQKILFDPLNKHPINSSYIKCSSWKEIEKTIYG